MDLRPLHPQEAAAAAQRAAVSFGAAADDEAVERWRRRIDAGQVLGLVDDRGAVLTHGRITLVDHWFGGRRVPTQHVASVAVPPEHRGRGVAAAFMRAVVARGAADGAGLSLLFPATTRLYRRVGYEHAGVFLRYRLDARKTAALGPPLRPAAADEWPAIRACGDLAASCHDGPAVRPDERWEELRTTTYHYVLDRADGGGDLDAYVLFNHVHEPGDWQYTLSITDWAALSAQGLAGVVGLVGSHGTLGKAATFRGPAPDPWSVHVAEQDVNVAGQMWWMARGLDLPAAVASRGFPAGLTGAVTFTVDDPLLGDARGPWRLWVDEGRGTLEPADAADVQLDVRAVGPLFTGFRSGRGLALAGLAVGPDDALDRLGAAFAGPVPHLLDFF